MDILKIIQMYAMNILLYVCVFIVSGLSLSALLEAY